MNGFIKRFGAVAILTAGLSMVGGCCHDSCQSKLSNCYDPCWPERYNAVARNSVKQACMAQANNGHALDQTIWNWHFENGTDRLTPGGMEQLNYIARRRPAADPHIFLQTAHDVVYNQKKPALFAQKRSELNAKREQAVMNYLQVATAGRGAPFRVSIHDPGEVGISAVGALQSLQRLDTNYRGVLTTTRGGAGGGGAGAGAGGGGGGRR